MGNPNLNFTQRLDEELKSCSMPKQDPRRATMEELIRDMHKILTGNGDFNHGLIFKVASTNVNLSLLREEVETVGGKVDAQVLRCAEIQAFRAKQAAIKQGEKLSAAKIAKAVWENKTLATMVVLTIMLFVFNVMNQRSPAADLDKKITQLSEKIAKLAPVVTGAPAPSVPTAKP